MKIKLIPKQKTLLKSSRVRKWLKAVEDKVSKEFNKPEIQEVMVLGMPIFLHSDGTLKATEIFRRRTTRVEPKSPKQQNTAPQQRRRRRNKRT